MTNEEVVVLLGMLRGAYGTGPTPERPEDFAFAVKMWHDSLERWPLDDAVDALEVMVNGGQQRSPNLSQMIDAIQGVHRHRLMTQPFPRELAEGGGIPLFDPKAQDAIWNGYISEVRRRFGLSEEEAVERARTSEVLKPWLVA